MHINSFNLYQAYATYPKKPQSPQEQLSTKLKFGMEGDSSPPYIPNLQDYELFGEQRHYLNIPPSPSPEIRSRRNSTDSNVACEPPIFSSLSVENLPTPHQPLRRSSRLQKHPKTMPPISRASSTESLSVTSDSDGEGGALKNKMPPISRSYSTESLSMTSDSDGDGGILKNKANERQVHLPRLKWKIFQCLHVNRNTEISMKDIAEATEIERKQVSGILARTDQNRSRSLISDIIDKLGFPSHKLTYRITKGKGMAIWRSNTSNSQADGHLTQGGVPSSRSLPSA